MLTRFSEKEMGEVLPDTWMVDAETVVSRQ